MSSYTMSFSSSLSFQRLSKVFRELPRVQPCYAVSSASSPAVVSFLREHRIPMICHNARQASLVGDDSLVIAGRRFVGSNEYIVRSVGEIAGRDAPASPPRAPAPLLWVHTPISHDGIHNTREMFEYIWAHKYIVNGIVFNVNNFSNPLSYIPPSMYSYKIALDYLFRNIIDPFEKEYGIPTPAIMMDARDHITQMSHLDELHSHIRGCRREKQPAMRLILGSLIDNEWNKII
jgi:hypothetical protein